MQRFIEYLNQSIKLNEDEMEFVRQVLSVKQLKKGEFLLREGKISSSFYFNLSGIIRLFYTRDIRELTAYFYEENTFISAYESFVHQTPAKLNLQTVEDTEVVEITAEAAQNLLALSPKFDALARIAMEHELIAHQKIIEALLTLKPEERYLQILNDSPSIIQRIPQHQIAAFIGIHPESLSRIKKRFQSKS